MRTVSSLRVPLCLLMGILFFLAPAALPAETSHRCDEEKQAGKGSSHLLTPKEMEAVFGAGLGSNAADFLIYVGDNPGRVILWDEGPASGVRSISNTLGIRN